MTATDFIAIRSVGGLLPVDTLAAAVEGKGLDGLAPTDYHLLPGETLRGEANRAWQRLLGAWRGFQDARARLPADDPALGLTRERWLLPLFVELGYGRLDTTAAGGIEVDGQAFPVSHQWRDTVIHLLGAGVDLDRRTSGVAGAAKTAPHAMLQELLNRSDEHLWAFLSNGHTLRVLRDNASLVRQAYLEFDLEAIFEGALFSEFVALFLTCHQSRLEDRDDNGPYSCWLELWRTASVAAGTRALDHLRDGVVRSLRSFGSGFLHHPSNGELRAGLASGEVSSQDYYRSLLRLVYRLLFVFVAEDRKLLHAPDSTAQARDRYSRYFSTSRLRRLAIRSRSADRHPDLWQSLQLVFQGFGEAEGLQALVLPSLGGFLFDAGSLGPLRGAQLANADLLSALRPLALVRDAGGLTRTIDYRNLDSEELGSVYESLLQLEPLHDPGTGTFRLEEVAGNERKTTGSFYTPSTLIASLLDVGLEPLLDETVRSATGPEAAEEALLQLTICDPACGSGHFLVAAARRIAKRLAAVRTGDAEPAPEALRTAVRDVVGHCLYGVDINDLAAELAKVSLWMEALEPGKPLSFLDAKIKVGNALLGATPALLVDGIPDAAFLQLLGDDKKRTSDLRKRNKSEREKVDQDELFGVHEVHRGTAAIAASRAEIEQFDDHSPAGLAARADAWRRLEALPELRHARFLADAWCASFVWPKPLGATSAITDAAYRELESAPESAPEALREEVASVARAYRFFHWHLEFPDVFTPLSGVEGDVSGHAWSGGFDMILGNPPWDTLSPDTREFFGGLVPGIRRLSRAEKDVQIAELLEDAAYQGAWDVHQRQLFGTAHFLKASGRYRMYAEGNLGKGDFNIYRSFAELALTFTRVGGTAGQILPSGIYAGANASAIRKYLLDCCTWTNVYGFNNKGGTWFPGVTLENFGAYVARVGVVPAVSYEISAAFGLHNPETLPADIVNGAVKFDLNDIRTQNPDTYAIPDIRDPRAARLTVQLYKSWPAFGGDRAAEPFRNYQAEIHMSDRNDAFNENPIGLPVYEGRMVDFFDHRAKRYVSGHGNSSLWEESPFDSDRKVIVPQWYVKAAELQNDDIRDRVQRYRIGFMDIADPGRQRSFVSAFIPPQNVCGHTVSTVTFDDFEWYGPVFLALANSLVIDFLARQRTTSKHMTFNILDTLPIARMPRDDPRSAWLAETALVLSCTSNEMVPLWNSMASHGWVKTCGPSVVPGETDPAARRQLRAELDAFVAGNVYGLTRVDLELILSAFIQLEVIETKSHGEFLTRRLVLEAFDRQAGLVQVAR